MCVGGVGGAATSEVRKGTHPSGTFTWTPRTITPGMTSQRKLVMNLVRLCGSRSEPPVFVPMRQAVGARLSATRSSLFAGCPRGGGRRRRGPRRDGQNWGLWRRAWGVFRPFDFHWPLWAPPSPRDFVDGGAGAKGANLPAFPGTCLPFPLAALSLPLPHDCLGECLVAKQVDVSGRRRLRKNGLLEFRERPKQQVAVRGVIGGKRRGLG